MENQARKRQELELWQAVDPARNNTMRGRKNSSGVQNYSNAQRRGTRSISNYNRTGSGKQRTEIESIYLPRATGAPSTKRSSTEIESIYLPRATRAPSTKRSRTEIESIYLPRATRAPSAKRPRTEIESIRQPRAGAENIRNPRAANVSVMRPSQAARRQAAARVKMQKQGASRRGTKIHTAKKHKVKQRTGIYRILALLWIVSLSVTVVFLGKMMYKSSPKENKSGKAKFVFEDAPIVENTEKKPKIQEDFLTISEYNRPGTKLASVKNIFVHYTANPKTSAAQNRSYFENLGTTHERAASAHFIIGYEGEVIQCIPLEEEAYAVIDRNKDSISIECCFINEDGSFTQETYDSLIEMLAWLTNKYHLKPQDILRHYDCGGKLCPIYYVEHEDAWQKLLLDVEQYTY